MKALVLFFGLVSAAIVSAQTPKPTIVLVHGAFADGNSWQKVMQILQQDGFNVTAVQNPLTSLRDDISATKRAIVAQGGPVVVVGHSYGGAVIAAAAAGNVLVTALVYVAAFAPEAGEVLNAPGLKFAASSLNDALIPDDDGFLYIDPARFRDTFAQDVPIAETRLFAAAQRPVKSSVFSASVPVAAWKTTPSWYIVASDDRVINPDLQRFYAQRMKATTIEIKSSHLPFLSHPKDVAEVIEAAAASTNLSAQ